jgi:transcription termination factor Rho
VYLLRTFLGDMPSEESITFLIKQMKKTKNNKEFFQLMTQ